MAEDEKMVVESVHRKAAGREREKERESNIPQTELMNARTRVRT